MYAQLEKSTKSSKTVSNPAIQKKGGMKQGFDFMDNRPELAAQRSLQGTILQKEHKSKHNRKKLALDKLNGIGGKPDEWRDRPSALSSSEADKALEDRDRNNHSSRHLTESGKLREWNGETEKEFKNLIFSILTSPFNTFFYDLRGEPCKGYISGDKIAALVYNSDGLIATTYVASEEQLEQWGVAPSFK